MEFLDQVDRIILDKPHYYNDDELDVMKFIKSNVELMNKKYSKTKQEKIIVKDAIDDENCDSIKTPVNSEKMNSITKEPISEIDLENEVYRLQDIFRKINEEFAIKRKQLEDDCCEQLKKLNDNSEKTLNLQQDLEQGKKDFILTI